MIVVLDTHGWIWFLNADPRLGDRARDEIEAATRRDEAVLSAISLWEISMLVARGRLSLPRDPREWLDSHLSRPGFAVHPLSIAVAVGSNCLPADLHGDTADRIIIATARHLDAILVTADQEDPVLCQGGPCQGARCLSLSHCGHCKGGNARRSW